MKKLVNQFTDNYTPEEIYEKLKHEPHAGWAALCELTARTNSIKIITNPSSHAVIFTIEYGEDGYYETGEHLWMMDALCDALSEIVPKPTETRNLFSLSRMFQEKEEV